MEITISNSKIVLYISNKEMDYPLSLGFSISFNPLRINYIRLCYFFNLLY